MHLPVQAKFDSFGYVTLTNGQTPEDAITTFPDQWKELYFKNAFYKYDPIFHFSNSMLRRSGATLLSSKQMNGDLFDAAEQFDANSNFVSVSHYGGNTMVFGGVNSDLDQRTISDCHSLCRATHRLDLARKLANLSDAQLDLMELAEEGHPDKEIASELGVSMSAVAQRKQVVCSQVGVTSFRAALQLYSLDKWGGLIAGKSC